MAGIWRPYSANLVSLNLVLITGFITGKELDEKKDVRSLLFVLCSHHGADTPIGLDSAVKTECEHLVCCA